MLFFAILAPLCSRRVPSPLALHVVRVLRGRVDRRRGEQREGRDLIAFYFVAF